MYGPQTGIQSYYLDITARGQIHYALATPLLPRLWVVFYWVCRVDTMYIH
jgi:hypothetical protein